MAARRALPPVSVPVLSKKRMLACDNLSSAPPPLTSTPRPAQRESPDTIATGTARISGQGVATTSTASARVSSPLASQASPATSRVTGTSHSA
ncbi:hypothetical protein D3C87_1643450 [compost metagenome]